MTPELQNILDNYKTKSNKELSNISVNLYNDFVAVKDSILVLSSTLSDLEKVYNAVFNELQDRLKFKDGQER